tara:strand:+ start:1254 stop:2984 length:1731 start_codon:yes stop_codon:yes gene_type:complete
MFKDLRLLLEKRNYVELLFLLISLLFTNILEYISIGLIVIYISFLADINLIIQYIKFEWLKSLIQKYEYKEIIIFSSFGLFFVFLFRNFYLAFNTYLLRLFSYKLTVRNSRFLFKRYLESPLEKHLESDQNKIIKIIDGFIYNSCDRIYNYLVLAREFVMIILISSFIFIYDPLIALLVFSSILLLSVIFISFIKNKIRTKSIKAQENDIGRVKIITQLFKTIKEIKVYNLEKIIFDNFSQRLKVVEKHRLFFNFINAIPRLYLELLAITGILGLCILFMYLDKPYDNLIPILSFIAVSATRLIPSFQLISTSLNVLNNTKIAFETVIEELKKNNKNYESNYHNQNKIKNIKFKSLVFTNINFKYKKNKNFQIEKINFRINKGDKVCVIGKSGSGKSTILSLMVNLLNPTDGQIQLNGDYIRPDRSLSYKSLIGYVSQDICLIEDTIVNNILLGSKNKKINKTLLNKALNISKAKEFIDNLEGGINTIIGSDGINLSGGQAQRIGLARALYRDPEILFLDEATSALDPITEKEIVSNLYRFFKSKTIISITHRDNFTKICNKKFKVNNGKLTSLSI